MIGDPARLPRAPLELLRHPVLAERLADASDAQSVLAEVGDFVIRRADGVFAYQLAVVVDDIAMRMTDVLRGADLVHSTPRQLLLNEALEAPPPRFTTWRS